MLRDWPKVTQSPHPSPSCGPASWVRELVRVFHAGKVEEATHQKGGDGRPCQEASQHVRPVVSVLGHADHAHQEGWAQQGQAERGFDQAGALHAEHESHVHLRGAGLVRGIVEASRRTQVDAPFWARAHGQSVGAGGSGQGLQGWSHGLPVGFSRERDQKGKGGGQGLRSWSLVGTTCRARCGQSSQEQRTRSGAQVSLVRSRRWGQTLTGLGRGHRTRGWSQGEGSCRSCRRWSP